MEVKRNTYVIIMAAGRGTRMGANMPKQFLRIDGKAILQITIEKFLKALDGVKIITVLPHEWIDEWKKYCLTNNFTAPQIIVQGGITRFHSVRNALARVPDGAVVAIHDGVRPMISTAMISRMFDEIISSEGAIHGLIPVIASTDTLRMIRKDGDGALVSLSEPTPDRSQVWRVQTPQIFLSEDIKSSYQMPYEVSFTDDASVADRKGIPLSFTEGERYNFKITTQEDLAAARAMYTSF